MKSLVLVIVGPTASGKSDLAVELALQFKGEVISADSRQVYKSLDIGTGKITKKEMRGIPHHLLDVADPKKRFSVSDYKKLAEEKLGDIVSRGKLPIIVGGTGLYVDSLTGLVGFPEVPPNKKLRKELEQKSAEELFKMLEKKDPARAKNIDQYNKVRLVRALEIIKAIGKVPSAHTSPLPPLLEQGEGHLNYEFIWIGLKPEKAELEKRIYARLLKRLSGMLKEATELHTKGLSYKRMEELGLEYRYLARLLQNKISKEEMVEELFKEIKQYSKRQYTWFKRNQKIKWFTLLEKELIFSYISSTIQKAPATPTPPQSR